MKNIITNTFNFIIDHKEFFLGYVVATTIYFTAQILSSLAFFAF